MSESSRAIDKKLLVNNNKARANILIADEFRMIDLDVINKVLRRFLSAPRTPGFLSNPKYEDLIERNKEIYMSSAWYASHWSYEKIRSFFVNMLTGKRYFVCSIPYQISIKEGLLSREQIEDEMSEEDFDAMTFEMEMEALFFSDTEGNFFNYKEINERRKIKNAFYPLSMYKLKGLTVPKLIPGEERILSVDVALMSSKRNSNDASSLIINSAIPINDTEFNSNFVYMENHEGLTGDDLALIIARTFYEYHCTQLVVDCNGVGMSVYDNLIKDQFDATTGKTYKAFTCCNDEEMASRCKVKDANKCLWSIKASANFNNEMCILLRSGFQNGKINLLVNEYEGEENLISEISGFRRLTARQQAEFKIAYVQTSYLINELINLEHEVKNGNIRVFEKAGARKDRYSSLGYNYWVLQQITRKKRPKAKSNDDFIDMLAKVNRMPKLHKDM